MIPSEAVRSHFLRTSLVLRAGVASSSSATSARRSWGNAGHLSPTNTAGASLSGPRSQGNHSRTQLGLQPDHKRGASGLVTRFHLAFKQLFSCDCASGKKIVAHGFQNRAISCASLNHTGVLSNPAWANILALTQWYCPDAQDQGFPSWSDKNTSLRCNEAHLKT